MPTLEEHLAKAEHNEATFLYLALQSSIYLDWQIVCLFYSALHYIDAYLHFVQAVGATHPRSHRRRRDLALHHLEVALVQDYDALQDQSEDARYNAIGFETDEVEALRAGRFLRIRTQVRAALGLPE